MSLARRPAPKGASTSTAGIGALLLCATALAGCARKEPPDPVEATLARERAAAHAEKGDHGRAREAIAPLVERRDAALEDLVRAAAIEFALSEIGRTEAFLERIEARAPSHPAALYVRGQIAREAGHAEKAVELLAKAHAEAPEDAPTRYALASALHDLDRREEAEGHYRAIERFGIEHAGSWYVAALYRLERLMLELGRDDDSDELYTRRQALIAQGIQPPGEAVLRLGTFARIDPPPAGGLAARAPAAGLAFRGSALELALLEGASWLAAHDLDGDGRMDLVALTPRGVVAFFNSADGWREEMILSGTATLARAFDADGAPEPDALEILVARKSEVLVLGRRAGAWAPLAGTLPSLPAPPADVVAVDYDHDGDLDLLLVGPFGARLWRNDGFGTPDGGFTDASEEAGLPREVALTWCATEDFDGDNDVDLLFGGPDGVFLADSLRGGRFDLFRDPFGPGVVVAERPLLADFDGDGRPDAWVPGAPSVLYRRTEDGRYERSERAPVPAGASIADVDRDGTADLLWDGAALLSAGRPHELPVSFAGWERKGPAGAIAFADFDGDLLLDAVRVEGARRELFSLESAPGAAKLVRLRGLKDNTRAVGAIVEVRARGIYRRIYYRGEQELVGAGPHDQIDVLRIRWPNGVVQTELDQDLGIHLALDDPDAPFGGILQSQGLVGSCPFLYSWNGETYEFVSDVLGITPLGLPIAPGVLVPPDHDEYVLVRGDQLAPKDGRYVLQLTEELREVTYLDRAWLEVIDHPAGTEVFPNERFTFPPFPEPHIHSVRAPLAPLRAEGSDGRDWAAELAAIDDVHAIPFRLLRPQLQGMAEPWWLELEFEREALADAQKLRLVMTGWFRWTDASVNVAVARTPGVEFVPPIVQVPDGVDADGVERWRDTGPPVGFPAGKTKTMVIDLSQLALAEDPRLRIACTLQLYWDRIVLAVCDDDAELAVTRLEPTSALLWERGFSAPLPVPREDVPERFDWERLFPRPGWDQHPGLYTRHGECLELVTAIDDRFVILGAGDALTLTFDATAAPPLAEGMVRDYLLFLDGWAKDRDPNTLEALAVEPLPFHGMSAYPYGPDERFPDGPEHRRWRREWNTRPARTWIPDLAAADR